MKKLGVSKAEDREWHKGSKSSSVDPFAISGEFLNYCVRQGWLIKEGSVYLATKKGKTELKKFGIKV